MASSPRPGRVQCTGMPRLRIGLAGAGLIGATHSDALREIAGAWGDRLELAAVADPDRERRERFVDAFGWRRATADPTDVLGDVDALFVCTPTRFHAGLVHAAAAAGVHLFCEKPIGMSHEEAAAMAGAVRRAGIHAQVGLVLRFSPVYTVMRELLRDAGHPMAVWFRDDQCFPIRGLHDSGWRKDPALSAGGTLIEHGVQDVDLLTWMFGPLARVRAVEHNRAGHPGIEDYLAADLAFTTGVRAQLLNVWHDMAGRPSNRRLEVFCQRAFVASEHDMFGEVEWQHDDHPLARLDADDVVRRYAGTLARRDDRFARWYGLPYFMQVLAFVEALLEDRPPAPGLDDGVEAQRVVEAIYRAARSGDAVEVSGGGGRSG
jgi:predicted dehydrogenase